MGDQNTVVWNFNTRVPVTMEGIVCDCASDYYAMLVTIQHKHIFLAPLIFIYAFLSEIIPLPVCETMTLNNTFSWHHRIVFCAIAQAIITKWPYHYQHLFSSPQLLHFCYCCLPSRLGIAFYDRDWNSNWIRIFIHQLRHVFLFLCC